MHGRCQQLSGPPRFQIFRASLFLAMNTSRSLLTTNLLQLGGFETSTQAAFILIGQMWYKRQEQGLRLTSTHTFFLHHMVRFP